MAKMSKKSSRGSSDKAVARRALAKAKKAQTEDIDEIDSFHEQRDKVLLGDEVADVSMESDDEQEVLQVQGADESSSSEEESSDDEYAHLDPRILMRMKRNDNDDSSEEEEAGDDEERFKSWGKNKRRFYKDEEISDDEEVDEEEFARMEEEEARRMQKAHMEKLQQEDFADGMDDSEDESGGDSEDDEELRAKYQKAANALSEVTLDDMALSSDDDSSDEEVPKGKAKKKKSSKPGLEKVEKDISGLSLKEKLKILETDAPELLALLQDMKTKLDDLKSNVQPLLNKVRGGELPTSDGVSLLEVKYQLLLSYCMSVAFYLLLKAEGQQVKDHPVIAHLVRLRVMLDKIRPIDNKIRYQVEKLLSMDTDADATAAGDDPLNFKPDLMSLADGDDEDADEDRQEGVYKVPKIAAARFDEEPRKEKKRKRKAKDSAVQEYLRHAFSNEPEEVVVEGSKAMQADEDEEHQQRYEEDFFLRLNETKAQKKKKARDALRTDFDDPIDYEDIADFDERDMQDQEESKLQRILKKSRMSSIISNIEQGAQKNFSADSDLPYMGLEEKQRLQAKREKKKRKRATFDTEDPDAYREARRGGSDDDLAEDPYYEQVKQAKKKRKIEREEAGAPQAPEYMDESVADGDKRSVSYKIEKNKGLRPHRAKKYRNPRIRYKTLADKSEKKFATVAAKHREQTGAYEGERGGISKTTVKRKKIS